MAKEVKNGEIVVHHINIRQSISILLFKLVTVDVISAIFVLTAYFFILSSEVITGDILDYNILTIIIFALLVVLKIVTTVFVVLQWINEYYELNPEYVYHQSGIFYKTKEQHKIDNIDTIEINQGVLGKLFNFGTINTYNYRHDKIVNLYLIHNPNRYLRILEELAPKGSEIKKVTRSGLREETD